jgi:nicotinamide mononucleotide adenylyltransferase
MNVKNRLRNNLVRKLQELSAEKSFEINNLFSKIESQIKSKDKTLKLAGTWKDLDDSFYNEMTEKLHDNRANDRQIN